MTIPSLVFYTPSIIPKACLFTMGVSVKEVDNPIGFFGTGLKYAIAIILRLQGKITIETAHDGLDAGLYEFYTRREPIRGKEFDLIFCSTPDSEHERMPMSTDYGKTWQPWTAMRELYSNTLDENGEVWVEKYDEKSTRYAIMYSGGLPLAIDSPHQPHDRPGTYITVTCVELYEAWCNKDKYFLDTKRIPLWKNDRIEVYSGSSDVFFYKGVNVAGEGFKSRLTYNLLHIYGNLSEDRTCSVFWIKDALGDSIRKCDNESVIERILDYDEEKGGYIEDETGYCEVRSNDDQKMFREAVLAQYKRAPHRVSPNIINAIMPYIRSHEHESLYPEVELSELDKRRFTHCFTMLKDHGFNFDNMTVSFCNDGDFIGLAITNQNKIVLHREKTLRHTDWEEETIDTLIHEYIHLKHSAEDASRKYESYALKYITHLVMRHKVDEVQ